MSKMEELYTETYKDNVITVEATQLILEQQKKIFIYKLTMINSWGLAMLEEISHNSQLVYQLMDDWVVDAVASENECSRQIIDKLIDNVKSERMEISEFEFQIEKPSLLGVLQPRVFSTMDAPLYMSNISYPTENLDSKRFETHHLN